MNTDKKNNPKQTKHPSQKQLARFLQGLLSRNQRLVVEQHVEKCDDCVEFLDQVANHSLDTRIRELSTRFDELASPTYPSLNEIAIPERLANHPRYKVMERIGVGGMGDVYRAIQMSMDREVAIKVLRRHLFENDRAIARFQNEVKVAAKLNHPCIVHSYDAEVASGLNILVMELVVGKKLSDVVLEAGRLKPTDSCRIAMDIAKGLEYAHSQGTIHRDIKPQNILVLPTDAIKITDFGLAKFVLDSGETPDKTLTLKGETFGTPDYVAPEQIRDSGAADRRSDIYSLGCTLYFMLTGRPPFLENSVGEKLSAHLHAKPDSVHSIQNDVSPSLSVLVETMMKKDPQQRFQSHSQVITALQPFLNLSAGAQTSELVHEEGKAKDAVTPTQLRLEKSERLSLPGLVGRRSVLLVAILAGVLLVSTGFAVVLWQNDWFASKAISLKPKIAIVIPAKFAFSPEIDQIYRFFAQQQRFEYEFIADQTGPVEFSNRDSPNQMPETIEIKRTLSDINASEFDGVIFTGGWNQVDTSPTIYGFDPERNREAGAFVRALLQEKKPIGSVGGGTVVLCESGILQGKKVANCQNIPTEVRQRSGAQWSEYPQQLTDSIVVMDGLIVTAGYTTNCTELCTKLVGLVPAK